MEPRQPTKESEIGKNRILHALLIAVCIQLAGCAAVSSALDLSHTERITTEGHLLIITEQDAFDQWREIVRSEKARAAGVVVLETGERYISTYDEMENTIALIALESYSQDLCRYAETAKSSGPINSEIEENGMTVTGINQELLDNCKKGQRTKVGWVSSDGVDIGGGYATLVIYVQHVAILEYGYRWIGTRCRDGWLSSSTGRGTCSWHGGVAAPAYGKVYVDSTDKE